MSIPAALLDCASDGRCQDGAGTGGIPNVTVYCLSFPRRLATFLFMENNAKKPRKGRGKREKLLEAFLRASGHKGLSFPFKTAFLAWYVGDSTMAVQFRNETRNKNVFDAACLVVWKDPYCQCLLPPTSQLAIFPHDSRWAGYALLAPKRVKNKKDREGCTCGKTPRPSILISCLGSIPTAPLSPASPFPPVIKSSGVLIDLVSDDDDGDDGESFPPQHAEQDSDDRAKDMDYVPSKKRSRDDDDDEEKGPVHKKHKKDVVVESEKNTTPPLTPPSDPTDPAEAAAADLNRFLAFMTDSEAEDDLDRFLQTMVSSDVEDAEDEPEPQLAPQIELQVEDDEAEQRRKTTASHVLIQELIEKGFVHPSLDHMIHAPPADDSDEIGQIPPVIALSHALSDGRSRRSSSNSSDDSQIMVEAWQANAQPIVTAVSVPAATAAAADADAMDIDQPPAAAPTEAVAAAPAPCDPTFEMLLMPASLELKRNLMANVFEPPRLKPELSKQIGNVLLRSFFDLRVAPKGWSIFKASPLRASNPKALCINLPGDGAIALVFVHTPLPGTTAAGLTLQHDPTVEVLGQGSALFYAQTLFHPGTLTLSTTSWISLAVLTPEHQCPLLVGDWGPSDCAEWSLERVATKRDQWSDMTPLLVSDAPPLPPSRLAPVIVPDQRLLSLSRGDHREADREVRQMQQDSIDLHEARQGIAIVFVAESAPPPSPSYFELQWRADDKKKIVAYLSEDKHTATFLWNGKDFIVSLWNVKREALLIDGGKCPPNKDEAVYQAFKTQLHEHDVQQKRFSSAAASNGGSCDLELMTTLLRDAQAIDAQGRALFGTPCEQIPMKIKPRFTLSNSSGALPPLLQ